ncbi:MAG: flagellar assembly protein FliW [Phycisphaeraceae bacterium]
MIVNTTRFGPVEVDQQRVLTFPKGVLGFPQAKQFALIQPGDEGQFFWLQACDVPELAFVVTDPSLFVKDYVVPLKPDQMEEMGMASLAEAQVFVIVNRRGNQLTGNLQGPLVVHTERRTGEQLVLSDRRFHTRVPLVDLGGSVSASA